MNQKHTYRTVSAAVAALLLTGAMVTPASAARPQWHWNWNNWNCIQICPDHAVPDTDTTPDTDSKPDMDTTPDTDNTPDMDVTPDTDNTPDMDATPDTDNTPDMDTTPDTDPTPETDTTPDSGSVSSLERQVVALVNQERAAYGLAPLTLSTDLSDGARLKSKDMRDNRYFDHNSPTYGTPFEMMRTLGITYRSAAENIAMGYRTAEAVVNGWMNSAGHRANILSDKYTEIGVGHVDGYWTQWFVNR
ncbi:CAP domain-containing protein [Candidatus Avoscillospira sp. LCP25S3_F1]|uniref:CAP domain-containing protein n=1 Tax=Candidatus Avoscillospira sp. LCP25S3_F1 TaxID=3438825 RepID=UPI003F927BFE